MNNSGHPTSPFRPTDASFQTIGWKSPANIALVKYWGKKPGQLPANPSLSFTLTHAYTETRLSWAWKEHWDESLDLDFTFEGRKEPLFEGRIREYLEDLRQELPFLRKIRIRVESVNTFPHSSGIASSASGLSALALCLAQLERELSKIDFTEEQFFRRASFLARLGSGSACRSVYGPIASWGNVKGMEGSHDEYATPWQAPVHDVFHAYCDAVLVVSRARKHTSSSAGHQLMNAHPFAAARYQWAHQHIQRMEGIFKTGDLDSFVEIVESEALQLHALMMTSQPAVLLWHAQTIEILHLIQTFRRAKRFPVCFTIDAGPNVHLLYPSNIRQEIESFIREELMPLCENQYVIFDQVGQGPTKSTL